MLEVVEVEIMEIINELNYNVIKGICKRDQIFVDYECVVVL